jgi:hypothetical protein
VDYLVGDGRSRVKRDGGVAAEVVRSWIAVGDGGVGGDTFFCRAGLLYGKLFIVGPSTFFSMIPLVDGPSVPAPQRHRP